MSQNFICVTSQTSLRVLFSLITFYSIIVPSQIGLIESLKRMQKRFLQLIVYKRRFGNNPNIPNSALTIQSILNLVSLDT